MMSPIPVWWREREENNLHFLPTSPTTREAERQRKHRDQVVKELEEELASHPDHRATAKWAIELMASGRYKRYLAIDRKDCVRLDRAAIREIDKYDGKWVLQPNDDTISLEDAASGDTRGFS